MLRDVAFYSSFVGFWPAGPCELLMKSSHEGTVTTLTARYTKVWIADEGCIHCAHRNIRFGEPFNKRSFLVTYRQQQS